MKDTFRKRKIQRYGYKPDFPDHRDYYFNVSAPVVLPPIIDLRANCPRIYNQGALGGCTANALAALYQYNEIVQKKELQFMPSRLFIYYNERWLDGNVDIDAGSTLREGIRSLCKWGAPDENLWPYHIEKFTTKPTQNVYDAAKPNIISKYSRIVQKITDLRTCLAQGHPFVLGFTVYDSFESDTMAKSGVGNMPNLNEEALGGHAVLCVGYDDLQSRFLIRNSWGANWGMGGYFTLPYEYILNNDLTGDIWTIQMVP